MALPSDASSLPILIDDPTTAAGSYRSDADPPSVPPASLPTDAPLLQEQYIVFPNTPLNRDLLTRLWRFNIVIGILLVCSGLMALTFPEAFTLAIEQVLGWILFLCGFVGVLISVAVWGAPGAGSFLVVAMLQSLVGFWLLASPGPGVISLTFILAASLFAQGLAKLNMAYQVRQVSPWPSLILSSFISIFLAVYILMFLPDTATWVLGVVFGCDLLVTGASMLAVACAAYCHPYHDEEEPLLQH